MKAIIGLTILAATTLALAAPDSCDDYVSRHYTKDLVPVGLHVSNVPRSGDLNGYQALEVTVQNQGSQTFEDHSAPGGLIHNTQQVQVDVTRHVRIHNVPHALTSHLRGWLQVPFAGGAQATITLFAPENLLTNCQKVDITVDSDRAAGQWGCQVFGNDKASFTVHLAGLARFCRPGSVITH